jgi:hypothetical protein
MNVIFHTADDQGLAIVIGENAAEVTMQFFSQRFIAEKWPAILWLRKLNGRRFWRGIEAWGRMNFVSI